MTKHNRLLYTAARNEDVAAPLHAMETYGPKSAVFGPNALMAAALFGETDCVRLPIPVSDPLATVEQGLTALMHADFHDKLACVSLIEAFSLSKHEASVLGHVVSDLVQSPKNGGPRV